MKSGSPDRFVEVMRDFAQRALASHVFSHGRRSLVFIQAREIAATATWHVSSLAEHDFSGFSVVHYQITTVFSVEALSEWAIIEHMPSHQQEPDRDGQVEQQRPARRKRKDVGQPRWEDRDYYVLQWIGEQGVIRFDQLRRLLGRESPDLDDWGAVLSESATRNAIDRWETGRLVNSAHIVPKEPKYYWLSNAGFQFVELELPHYCPKRQEVPLLFACNQIRLYVELLARQDNQEFGDHWECGWISARMLAQRHPEMQLHLPIAQFETPKRDTLALELVQGSVSTMEPVMHSYTKGLGYSEIWYFAPSSVLPELEAIREKLRRSGLPVDRIYTFNADAILVPPPKRTKKANKR